MKRTMILSLSLLFVLMCSAQKNDKKDDSKTEEQCGQVDFYGVDFSQVNVVDATESNEQFLVAFEGINGLMVDEAKKYDPEKFFGLKVRHICVDDAINQIRNLNNRNFRNTEGDTSLVKIISAYPTTESHVLLIVAKELNKSKNVGTFVAVVYNGETKEILNTFEIEGEGGGFGLRNYWAGSIYDGMKRYSRKKRMKATYNEWY